MKERFQHVGSNIFEPMGMKDKIVYWSHHWIICITCTCNRKAYSCTIVHDIQIYGYLNLIRTVRLIYFWPNGGKTKIVLTFGSEKDISMGNHKYAFTYEWQKMNHSEWNRNMSEPLKEEMTLTHGLKISLNIWERGSILLNDSFYLWTFKSKNVFFLLAD